MGRKLAVFTLVAALWPLAGFSREDDAALRRLDALAAENNSLKQKLAQCDAAMKTLRQRLDKLDALAAENARLRQQTQKLGAGAEARIGKLEAAVRQLEKALAQAEEDLRTRMKEMVVEQSAGRARRFARPAARPPVEPKPYLGFDAETNSPELAEKLGLKAKTGIAVTFVRIGAAAEEGGLKKGDVVQQLDGAAMGTKEELGAAIARKRPGDAITLGILRGDKKLELKLTLGEK